MRASTVTRRAARSTVEEEKKDDNNAVASSLKATAAPPNSGTSTQTKFRRRRKSKDRRRGLFFFLNTKQMRTLIEFSPGIIALFVLVIFLAFVNHSYSGRTFLRWSSSLSPSSLSSWSAAAKSRIRHVALPVNGKGGVHFPHNPAHGMLMEEESHDYEMDFGGLDESDFEEELTQREIYYHGNEKFFAEFAPSEGDSWYGGEDAYYYNMDDDEKRNPYHGWEEYDLSKSHHCRRVAFHRDLHLNCNNFHSLDLPKLTLQNGVSFIGAGSYRDVFLVEHQTAVDRDMVLKVAEIHREYDQEAFECMRMEGAVASHLSPNPLIVDIYGFCALSMFNEAMMQGDVETRAVPLYHRSHCNEAPQLDGDNLVTHMNNITATTKLEWALNMVEAMTYLHNFEKGVIVHDDIQLPQFMITDSGRLKLGDFNRAEFMLYDEEHGEYCKYRNGHGHGDWRAPEEYRDDPLNEKIDIWSLGMNFYGLLTGVYPFSHLCKEKLVQQLVKDGEIPFIDPRWEANSFAEGELAKIIKDCWAFEAKDRPTIGELVVRFRKAVLENQQQQKN